MKKINFNFDWDVSDISDSSNIFGEKPKPQRVNLPHDAMILGKRSEDCPNGNSSGFFWNSDYLYEKTFYVPEKEDKKTFILEFEGIYMNAQIWVNHNYIDKCDYGYTDFYLNITDWVIPDEENLIQVYTKASMNKTTRWYSGTGIYRDVNLHIGPDTYFEPDGVRILTARIEAGEAKLEIFGKIAKANEFKALSVKIDIVDEKTEQIVKATEVPVAQNGAFGANLIIKSPKLWSVDTPDLYRAELRLIKREMDVDQDSVKFGIRTIEAVSQKGLLINGVKTKLRGGCIHHDNGPIGAAEYDDAAYRRIRIMKEAGFNAIRSAHNPISKSLLRACDKLGMMVMDESFDTWHTAKSEFDYTLFFDKNWRFDLEMMVKKDFNHPSVIMYTFGNEIQELDTLQGQKQNRMMADFLRSMDPTRLTSNAVNGMFTALKHIDEILPEIDRADSVNTDNMEINNMMTVLDENMGAIMRHRYISEMLEPITDALDVACYNYMDGRYETDAEKYPHRIIVGSEARPSSIAKNWRMVKNLPNVFGDFVWAGWDYIGEAGTGKVDYTMDASQGMYGAYPWYLANCGDIDICGRRRPQSYYREIVWGLRKKPYIVVGRPEHYQQPSIMNNWSWFDGVSSWTWPGYEGKPVQIEVYADADEAELLINGMPVGRKTAGEDSGFKAVFDTIYEPGKIEAVTYKQGKVVSDTMLETALGERQLYAICDKECTPADGQSLVYIDVDVVDKNGIYDKSASDKVDIVVDGTAELLGYGNSDPKSMENFYDKTRTLYDGHLTAVLRAPREPGEAVVSFRSDRMPAVSVKLTFVNHIMCIRHPFG